MPRNPGTGVYEQPAPDVITATTIESAVYNGFVNDVETDLNTPRPIVAGGTGATDAKTARSNLQTEIAVQTVTNYDSHAWESGSFWSHTTATGAPVNGEQFTGVVVLMSSNPDFPSLFAMSVQTGKIYYRHKNAGVWTGPWLVQGDDKVDVAGDTMTGPLTLFGDPTIPQHAADKQYVDAGDATNAASDALKVAKAGDTMTGDLMINKATPTLTLAKPSGGSVAVITSRSAGNARWQMYLGDATAESGGNVGSDFQLNRCNDAGTIVSAPIAVARSSGVVSMNAPGGFGSALTNALHVGYTGNTNHGITTRSATDGGFAMAFLNSSGAIVGSIQQTAAATAYVTSSDDRLKDDLQPVTTAGQIIDDTNVYDFAWKTTGERSYGVIAQQAQTVYPAAVTYVKDHDWWGIDYSRYVPVILQELKSVRQRYSDALTRIERLEAALAKLPP